MSYILEALKKSDQSRKRAEVPDINTVQGVAVKSRMPVWALPVIVTLLLVIIGLLYWLLVQRAVVGPIALPPAAVTAPVVVTKVPVVAVQKAAPKSAPKPAQVAVTAEAEMRPPAALPKAVLEVPVVVAPKKQVTEPYANVMWWDELSSALRGELPYPKLDVHVYAKDIKRRFVLVNLSKYRSSDSLPSGAVIDAIVPDGVVLSYDGTRYKIRRP